MHPESIKSSRYYIANSPTELIEDTTVVANNIGKYDAEDMTSRMQYQTRLNIAEARIDLDESQGINFKNLSL